MPLPLIYPHVLLVVPRGGKGSASYNPPVSPSLVIRNMGSGAILASNVVATDFEFIGDTDGDMHGWSLSLSGSNVNVVAPSDLLSHSIPGYTIRAYLIWDTASDPAPLESPVSPVTAPYFTIDFTPADVVVDGTVWIPPFGYVPPGGWTFGDPPPSPWVDGDPVPDGWTPPDGYVPADTCTYGITPEEVIVPYVAGSAVVDINASGPDCAWTTLPNDGWIFGTYSGTGTQTREISWTANLTSATRIGTVTMAGLTFMVIQLPPPPPDNISIQTGCHGASVTLTWDAMPSAVGYNIYRDGSLIASVSALAQTYTDTGVLIGTRYSYQIETRYPSSVVGTRSDRYFKTPCTTCPVDDLSDWQSLCAVDTKYSPVVSAWEETCGSEQRWVQKSIPAPLFKEKVVSP